MAVPLGNFLSAVELQRRGFFLQHTGVGAQPHRPALTLDSSLGFHEVNNGIRAVRIKFARVGAPKSTYIACKLDHRHLHAETDPEERNLILTRVTHGFDFSFAAAVSKPSRHQNAIGLTQDSASPELFNLLSLDAVQFDFDLVC